MPEPGRKATCKHPEPITNRKGVTACMDCLTILSPPPTADRETTSEDRCWDCMGHGCEACDAGREPTGQRSVPLPPKPSKLLSGSAAAGRQTTPCGCPEEALIRSHVEGCPWFTAFVEAGRQTTCFCGQPDDRERVHRSNACEPWVGREATAECPACAGYEDGPYRDLCDSCRAEVLRGERPTGGDDA